MRVYFCINWSDCFGGKFFHFGVSLLPKFILWPILNVIVIVIKISLKVSKGKLVSRFEFPIIFTMLLDCVICEMDHAVGQILHIKLFASCANIAILKPITLLDSINTCHQYIASNVKFSFLVEKRHDILLDNVSSTTAKAVSFLLSNYFFDLFDTLHNLYAYASICVLARLN